MKNIDTRSELEKGILSILPKNSLVSFNNPGREIGIFPVGKINRPFIRKEIRKLIKGDLSLKGFSLVIVGK